MCSHWTSSEDLGRSLETTVDSVSYFGVCMQDLESKSLVDELKVDRLSTNGPVECMSLAWSSDGGTLFAGYTDNLIRVYDVEQS